MGSERYRTGQLAVSPLVGLRGGFRFRSRRVSLHTQYRWLRATEPPTPRRRIRVSMANEVVERYTNETVNVNGRSYSDLVACLDAERIHRDDRRPRPP
jgi:hypothetical protein